MGPRYPVAQLQRQAVTVEAMSSKPHTPSEEDEDELLESARSGSDTEAAILGASLVEFRLEAAIKLRLARMDDATWARLVGDGGPFATFNQKILMGYAFGYYGSATLTNLRALRVIRNLFAHPRQKLEFSSEPVRKELRKVVVPDASETQVADAFHLFSQVPECKEKYVYLCISMLRVITHNVADELKQKLEDSETSLRLNQSYLAYVEYNERKKERGIVHRLAHVFRPK